MLWLRILWAAGTDAHVRALKEVLTVLFVSMTPLLVGALIQFFLNYDKTTYVAALHDNIKQGELFAYCLSVTASIIWLANKDWLFFDFDKEADKVTPPRLFFNLYAMVVFGFCLMFFGIGQVKVAMPFDALILASLILYVPSILIWYIIIIFSDFKAPSYETELSDGAKALMARIKKARARNGT